MIHNYFADLELDINATVEDVQRAYRRLAKKYHPDINHDVFAAQSFRLIREAYTSLNSVSRIQKHKKDIENQISGIQFAQKKVTYSLTPIKREEFIEISGIYRKKNRSLKTDEDLDIHLVLTVNPDELENEGEKYFEFPYRKPCATCLGRGINPSARKQTCKQCKGHGVLKIQRGAMSWDKACEACDGKGVTSEKCSSCRGSGVSSQNEQIHLRLHRKFDFTKPLEFKGLGNFSETGKRRGNAWVQVVVRT